MNRVEKTLDYALHGGLNCSQAILAAFGEPLGIDPDAAGRLGRLWGGGVGRLGETCGYLTGAVLVLAHVQYSGDEIRAQEKGVEAVRHLFNRFSAKRGTIRCKELLGADISTVEGLKRIKEEQSVKRVCHGPDGIGREVAEILTEILEAP